MANDSTQSWENHAAAIQAGADQAAVDAAVRALQPLIEQTAERVCRRRRVSKQIRLDFVDEAVAFVLAIPRESKRDGVLRPPIANYNSASGSFPAWLRTVLDHRLSDILRSAGRRAENERTMVAQQGKPGFIKSSPELGPHHTGAELDRTSAFNDSDLEKIVAWPVLDRILVLVVFELWRKIPKKLWRNWCMNAKLPTPFPPEDAVGLDRSKWINRIAGHLSASPNALQNRL